MVMLEATMSCVRIESKLRFASLDPAGLPRRRESIRPDGPPAVPAVVLGCRAQSQSPPANALPAPLNNVRIVVGGGHAEGPNGERTAHHHRDVLLNRDERNLRDAF